jgi:phenylpropionate dioxygenase-like ring-hydroxylating dioxygenase large terminal subunit
MSAIPGDIKEVETPLGGHHGFTLQKAPVGTTSSVGEKSRLNFTLARILEADGQGVPVALQTSNLAPLPPVRISMDRYYKKEFVDLEVEHIWKRCWQVACREEDIPNVGDRVTYDIVNLSFILVRTAPQQIKAFYNSCPHRGRRLCSRKETGIEAGNVLRCPFHAWTWSIDGSLTWIPSEEDFPHVAPQKYALQEVRVDTWGGNVFINPDPDGPSLAQSLGNLPDMFRDHPMEERYTILHIRKKIRANWKLIQEAFMEGYHVVETHWDGMPYFGSAYTQYDNWDDGVAHYNRLVTPSVIPDVWIADKVSPEESARQFCSTFGLPLPPNGSIDTVTTARRYCANERKKLIKGIYGVDLSERPDSYVLEMAKFFLFPNHHPWWGEALPWWYRFTPFGDDPEAGIMEIRVTAPLPPNGKRPPTATPIDVDFDTRCVDIPEMGVAGYIVDQDISNLVEVQRGVKAAPEHRAFMTLGRYQEKNIQHFHHVYNALLGLA